MPAPPLAQNGPFTELRLAPSPVAAVFGLAFRRRAGSEQPIWQTLRDAQGAAIYRVDAPGVRIKDCHSDSRLVGGVVELRRQGEQARRRLGLPAAEDRELVATRLPGGGEDDLDDRRRRLPDDWETLDAHFDDAVAAAEVPDDADGRSIKADWVLVGSVPRLETLAADGPLSIDYTGRARVSLVDLLRLRDVAGRRVGGRVAYYLARELARDLLSVRRQRSFRDWARFVTALLGALSGLGSISWLLSKLLSSLS